jgi:circadian clock protein KaiC
MVLVSGVPGTAKSTLAASFVCAACERGERALLVSFDEFAGEVVRNSASVGIDLQRHVESGTLKILGLQRESRSAEAHLLHLRGYIEAHAPDCVVIDPVSALIRSGGELEALDVISRLLRVTKQAGVTTLLTSLLREGEVESARLPISTIADTWIHLTYIARGGERNRTLSVIKARGTGHSNQVRELVLSHDGVRLSQVYVAGGEVLMGTLRWEKEDAERQEARRRQVEREQLRGQMTHEAAELRMKVDALRRRIEEKENIVAQLEDDAMVESTQRRDRADTVYRLRRGAKPDDRDRDDLQ